MSRRFRSRLRVCCSRIWTDPVLVVAPPVLSNSDGLGGAMEGLQVRHKAKRPLLSGRLLSAETAVMLVARARNLRRKLIRPSDR
jgi:hypothetical protein